MAPLLPCLLLFTARHSYDSGVAVKRPLQPSRSQPPPEAVSTANAQLLRMKISSSSDDNGPENAAVADEKGRIIPVTAAVSLSLATLAAFTQRLPGPPIDATSPPPFFSTLPFGVFFSGSCEPYAPSLIYRDLFSSILSIAGATIFVKAITLPVNEGNLEPRDARKIIHTLSAPLFILLWPLFSKAFGARVFAGIVPLLNAVRLFLAGTGDSGSGRNELAGQNRASASDTKNSNSIVGSESELAGAISRSGDAREALGGPFIYVLVLLLSTVLFWTDSPIGVVPVATMAVGDGLADLVGRRLGSSNRWSFNENKSVVGSAAFVVGSFVGSYGLISWLTGTGTMYPLELGTAGLAGRLAIIAVVCAGVELIPVGDDNWSVPLAAVLLSAILLN